MQDVVTSEVPPLCQQVFPISSTMPWRLRARHAKVTTLKISAAAFSGSFLGGKQN
jgi:hypothetical protein